MISINLLPEDRKKEIKRKKWFRMIVYQETLFLLMVVAFIAILAGNEQILTIELDGVEKTMEMEKQQKNYQDLIEYEKKFDLLNEKLSNLSGIYNKHLYWTNVFDALNSVGQENIAITGLSNDNYTVLLSGKAKTRDDLLSFQEKINGISCFNDADIPLSNLVTKEDVDFQMEFTVQEKCLKQSGL